jgi:hypothetical protein
VIHFSNSRRDHWLNYIEHRELVFVLVVGLTRHFSAQEREEAETRPSSGPLDVSVGGVVSAEGSGREGEIKSYL